MSAPEPVSGGMRALALARPGAGLAGGLAVIGGSTALAGVIQGWVTLAWVAAVAATVVIVGTALRAVRAPLALVLAGQLVAVACLLTVAFTDSGLLGVLPGAGAVRALALTDEITSVHATGRPVLVGTASVHESEHLSRA
ncbi:MAG: transglutaminase, partial [Pseudonocardia sp.]|nr:transglutaminase [Pseudonocardia sp.]